MYIYTVIYCCEVKYQTNRYITENVETKVSLQNNKKQKKIPTEYCLLSAWEKAELTRLWLQLFETFA